MGRIIELVSTGSEQTASPRLPDGRYTQPAEDIGTLSVLISAGAQTPTGR